MGIADDRCLSVVPFPPANEKTPASHRKPLKVLGWRSARRYSQCHVSKMSENLCLPHVPTSPARRSTQSPSSINSENPLLPHIPARCAGRHTSCHAVAGAEDFAHHAPAKPTRGQSHGSLATSGADASSRTIDRHSFRRHTDSTINTDQHITVDEDVRCMSPDSMPLDGERGTHELACVTLRRVSFRAKAVGAIMNGQGIHRHTVRRHTDPTMHKDQHITVNEDVRCISPDRMSAEGDNGKHKLARATFRRASFRAKAVEAIMNGHGLFGGLNQESISPVSVVSSINDKLTTAISVMRELGQEHDMSEPDSDVPILKERSLRNRTTSMVLEGMQKQLTTALMSITEEGSQASMCSQKSFID